MNVQVVFQGLMLWWMLGAQPMMLIPNFARDTTAPHHAAITAPPQAFGGNGCPAPFTLSAGGECRFALDGAGASGGVRITFTGGTSQFAAPEFCALPSIVSPQQLALLPEFTPPTAEAPTTGASLTAWMPMIGGAAGSFTQECDPTDPADCPRAAVWSLAPPIAGMVSLQLDNLNGGGSVSLPLMPGAIVTIANQPDEALLASRAKHAHHGKTKGKAARATTGSPSDTYDWCLYYQMFKVAGGAVPCVAPQMPPRLSCGVGRPTTMAAHHHRGNYWIGTIACSNSQYP